MGKKVNVRFPEALFPRCGIRRLYTQPEALTIVVFTTLRIPKPRHLVHPVGLERVLSDFLATVRSAQSRYPGQSRKALCRGVKGCRSLHIGESGQCLSRDNEAGERHKGQDGKGGINGNVLTSFPTAHPLVAWAVGLCNSQDLFRISS